MISTKLKLWRSAGAIAALAAASACAPAEQAPAAAEQAAAPAPSAPAPAPAAGGEQGEAGVAGAYAGLEGEALTRLRLQHLKGFVLIAERMAADGKAPEAAVLVGQGLLEVYDPAADQFGALDPAALRAAAQDQDSPDIAAAKAAIDQAESGVEANPAEIAARMTDMAAGLYQHVFNEYGVDPIEYQHSLGMALAARDALTDGRAALTAENAARYQEAAAELDRFIALYPAAEAPETPAEYAAIVRQSSRVRLALSAFL